MAEAPASPAPDRRFLALVAALAAIAFGVACVVLHLAARAGLYGPVSDAFFVTPFWQDAIAVVNGAVPYRDFALEYPPLSLPVFVLPALLPFGGTTEASYTIGFEVVMAGLGMGVVPLVVATVAHLGGRRADVLVAAGAVAASPLVVGPLAISRYDLWPALLTAAAMVALLRDRDRLGFAVLGLGVLAKVYPGFLVPVCLAWVWRRAGGREAAICLGLLAAVVAAGLLPFVAVAPAAALDPFTRSIARPLQIESLGASVLIALHDLAGLPLERTTYEFESYNLRGALPSAAATLQTLALGILVLGIWLEAFRGRMTAGRFVVACAAVLCGFVALGKVLSPQYVLWLLPAIAVLAPVRGYWPLTGLIVVMLLTSAYYPSGYVGYIAEFNLGTTITVLARNVGLVVLAGSLAAATGTFGGLRPSAPGPPPARRPRRPEDRAPSAA